MWNPLNLFRRKKAAEAAEKARRIVEEIEALKRIGTYKEKTREELLEEVRKQRAGRKFVRGVEEEARFVATHGLPAPVDVKSLFLAGNRREAAKIMMQRGMGGKEIEEQFQIWAREGVGVAGPPIPGYPPPEPKALPAVATRGEDLAEKLIEDFRQGRVTGDAARRGVADLVRRGWLSVGDANAALERISRMRDSEGRVIVPRYPPAEGRVRRFVEAGLESTTQGGLRPTVRQLRAPLYGKVPTDSSDPRKRMQKLDPEVRSAINRGRKELQKAGKEIFEKKIKPAQTATTKEMNELTKEITEEGKLLEAIVKRLNELSAKEKQTERSPSGKTEQGGGESSGGPLGG